MAKAAASHGIAPSAVLLRWNLDQNVVPIRTTTNTGRMDEYLEALQLTLTKEGEEDITRVGLTHHFRFWGWSYFDDDDRS